MKDTRSINWLGVLAVPSAILLAVVLALLAGSRLETTSPVGSVIRPIGQPHLLLRQLKFTPANPAYSQLTNQLRVSATYKTLPMHFEANRGQTDPQVKFVSRGRGYTLF